MRLNHRIGLSPDYEIEQMEGHHQVWIRARYTGEPTFGGEPEPGSGGQARNRTEDASAQTIRDVFKRFQPVSAN